MKKNWIKPLLETLTNIARDEYIEIAASSNEGICVYGFFR